MTLIARFVPSRFYQQRSPYRIALELAPPKREWLGALDFFGVTAPNLLTYLLTNWVLFSVAPYDIIYEEVVDDITTGSSIFRTPAEWERTETFFRNLEYLMDMVFYFRDQLAAVLRNTFNPSDPHDATSFRADWIDPVTVSIHVTPRIDPYI